ncbi:MAG TPA: hypothetical protein VF173_34770 [Thermoanaerobaculia bacterium]|nr:hypothetical protein [Thermoanaerobaculia bacterium]
MQGAMSRLSSLLVPLVLLGAAAPPAPAPPPAPAGIHILSDSTLPQAFEWATDVRWASDKSVYLGLSVDGTVEVGLDPAGSPPKEMIPGRSKPGGFWSSQRVAASSQYLAAAGPALVVTWRRLEDPTRVEVPFDTIQGIDVRDNRFAIVGAQRNEKGDFGADGAIAWIGTLDKKLADLRPLLYDVRGLGVPTMNRCGAAPIGAVRFLPDGSLVVVPGVQPGVNLYDRSGKLVRTWDDAAIGIDTGWGTLTDEQALHIMGPAAARNDWLNRWRVVDSVLPLQQGPGLVVRRAEKARTRWELKLLRFDGSVQSFQIPVEGETEFFHLGGDVRRGKIVFLLRETVFRGGGKDHPALPRLILADPPGGLEK